MGGSFRCSISALYWRRRPVRQTVGDLVVVVNVDGRRVCLEIDDAEIVVREPRSRFPPGATLPWAIGVARHPDGLVPLLDLAALSSRFMEAGSA